MKVAKLNRTTPPVREAEKDWLPMIAWGRPPFAPVDEIDGAHVGRMTLRRDPVTGAVVGVLDDSPRKEN